MVRLVSQAGTGHFYTTTRNKQKDPLEFLKHDPVGKEINHSYTILFQVFHSVREKQEIWRRVRKKQISFFICRKRKEKKIIFIKLFKNEFLNFPTI